MFTCNCDICPYCKGKGNYKKTKYIKDCVCDLADNK